MAVIHNFNTKQSQYNFMENKTLKITMKFKKQNVLTKPGIESESSNFQSDNSNI